MGEQRERRREKGGEKERGREGVREQREKEGRGRYNPGSGWVGGVGRVREIENC